MEDIVIIKLLKSLVELKITVPEAEVLLEMDRAANRISAEIEIKGFRKGAVPANILEKYVGKEKIFEEACYLTADRKFSKAIESEDLMVIGKPKMEVLKMALGNPFEFKVTAPVYPEVKLADYRKIAEKTRGEKKPAEAKEEEIAESLRWLQKSRRKETLAARAAKKGDLVEIDFEARVGGVKIEGGESRNHPLVLGESKFISGFDKQVENVSAGESKNFSLTAPPDFPKNDLRGRKIDFSITVRAVYDLILPELDDKFAQSLGDFKDLNALKESIKAGINTEKELAEKDRIRQLFSERAAKGSEIEIADALIDEEVESMIQEMKHNFEDEGLNFSDYLLSIKRSQDDLRKDLKNPAELRVKVALVFPEIAKRENIAITDEDLMAEVNKLISRHSEFEKLKTDTDLLKGHVYGILMKEKVFEVLEI